MAGANLNIDVKSPLAAMRSSAKLNHEVYTGGTLLNLRLSPDLVKNEKSQRELGKTKYKALGVDFTSFTVPDGKDIEEAYRIFDKYNIARKGDLDRLIPLKSPDK